MEHFRETYFEGYEMSKSPAIECDEQTIEALKNSFRRVKCAEEILAVLHYISSECLTDFMNMCMEVLQSRHPSENPLMIFIDTQSSNGQLH